jgi:hypothetical protein
MDKSNFTWLVYHWRNRNLNWDRRTWFSGHVYRATQPSIFIFNMEAPKLLYVTVRLTNLSLSSTGHIAFDVTTADSTNYGSNCSSNISSRTPAYLVPDDASSYTSNYVTCYAITFLETFFYNLTVSTRSNRIINGKIWSNSRVFNGLNRRNWSRQQYPKTMYFMM